MVLVYIMPLVNSFVKQIVMLLFNSSKLSNSKTFDKEVNFIVHDTLLREQFVLQLHSSLAKTIILIIPIIKNIKNI